MEYDTWGFFKIWNDSLTNKPERDYDKRSHVWASEIGGAMIDRYLKMTGVKPTNPPNDRSKRKFETGNFVESLIGLVLFWAGLLIDEQVRYKFQYPDTLEVTGYADFKAGGSPDWEKVIAELESDSTLQRIPFIKRTAEVVAKDFSIKYPEGLKPQILEIKSSSIFMFEKYEKYRACDPKHKLQAYTYLLADKDINQANVVYYCKDDSRLLEIGIVENEETSRVHHDDLLEITGYISRGEQPPKESEIVYMPDTCRFSANWKIEYSPYLTMLYGYNDGMEFREKYMGSGGMVSKWNYTLNRSLNGANMTANNLEIIKQINEHGFDYERIIEEAKGREIIEEEVSEYEG